MKKIMVRMLAVAFIVTISLSALAVPTWTDAVSSGGTDEDDGQAIAMDSNGDYYVTGYFSGTADFGPFTLTSSGESDIFVAKFMGTTGWCKWAIKAGGTSSDEGKGIAIDGSGNIYMTGSFQGTADFGNGISLTSVDSQDAFLACYNSGGTCQWAKQIGTDKGYRDEGNGICVGALGNIIVTGVVGASLSEGNMFIGCYNNSGEQQWMKNATGDCWGNGVAYGTTAEGSTRYTVIGSYYTINFGSGTGTSNGGSDIFVAEYDSYGNYLWSMFAGGPGSDYGNGVTAGTDGLFNITGSFEGTVNFWGNELTASGGGDIFVSRIFSGEVGSSQWTKQAGGDNITITDTGNSVTADEDNVIVTGSFAGTADFGNGVSLTSTTPDSSDIFVAVYEPSGSGTCIGAVKAGGDGAGSGYRDEGMGIVSDSSGNCYVTGLFGGTANFGSFPLTSAGFYDVFSAKLRTKPILAMDISSENGGNTTPASGEHIVTANEPQDVTATAAEGYTFMNWTVTEAGTVADPNAATTTVTLVDDATLTANFLAPTGTLTMEVSPAGTGSTDPFEGPNFVSLYEPVNIIATANEGYTFISWSESPNAAVYRPTKASTTVTLNGDASVTANFAETGSTTTLTMAMSKPFSGETIPEVGESTVVKNTVVNISVIPEAGLTFTSWTATANATVANPYSPNTTVILTDNATVTANIADPGTTAILTMAVEPVATGTTSPPEGSINVVLEEAVNINATPAIGYTFSNWTSVQDVTFGEATAPTTTVTLAGDATVTANFVLIPMANLTMVVAPASSGTITPTEGTYSVPMNQPQDITATPANGYAFDNWSADQNASFGEASSAITTVTLNGNATVTANFKATIHTVTFVAGTGGTLEGTSPQIVDDGANTTPVSANSDSGYRFIKWTDDQGSEFYDNPVTIYSVTRAWTVTANFQLIPATAQLTMGVIPDGAGTTIPAGASTVETQKPISITATVAPGYRFLSWESSQDANIADQNSASTTAVLYNDASIDAFFVEVPATAELTVDVFPFEGGTTIPSDVNNYSTNTNINVTATPASGYHFTEWDISPNGTIANKNAASTTVKIFGITYLQAIFEVTPPKANVVIAVEPPEAGTTNPAGVQEIDTNVGTTIVATPNQGYIFINWTATPSGNANFTNANLANTTVTILGDVSINANFAQNATLTMAVSPEAGGTTSPAIGAHSVQAGSAQNITATAATGYTFVSWTKMGPAIIANANSANTTVTISGDATVTANFNQIPNTADLTMAVSPAASGTTNPVIGTSSQSTDQPVSIVATAASGYTFKNWSGTANATIASLMSPNTTVTLSGSATVTANFAQNVTLTMAVLPAAGGTTSPVVGTSSVPSGVAQNISATAATGYTFSKWSSTANATIASSFSSSTSVTLTGEATVTAEFNQIPTTANLTIQVNPMDSGTTTPAIGTSSQNTQQAISIVATAATGYSFLSWSKSPEATIANVNAASTTVTITDDATITANFAQNVTLTMASTPQAGGLMSPAAGAHTVATGVPQNIIATAAAGYVFANWTATANATVADPNALNSTATLAGDATVTANFAEIPETANLTMGITPEAGGTTTPAAGTSSQLTNQEIAITATATEGYSFTAWTKNGPATIANPNAASTTVTITDNAVVFANFAENVTLTMAVNPQAGGTTTPVAGTSSVPLGIAQDITAIPAAGYTFVNWTATANATVANPNSSETSATLTGAATITANFAEIPATANLTMGSFPEAGGTTSPASGTSSQLTNQAIAITATAAEGYGFVNWSSSSEATIADINAASTTATITGDAYIQANFAAQVTLTMVVNPIEGGSTEPFAGHHNVGSGSTIDIVADPENDYKFINWTKTGDATIANENLSDTTATVTGDATITANFELIPATASLTMAVSPAGSGTTTPTGTSSVNTETAIPITATAAEGYHFFKWTSTTEAQIADANSASTTARLLGDATVTASFEADSTTATLTMAVNIENIGTTVPATGSCAVETNVPLDISATPLEGYSFINWTADSGNANFTNANAAATTMTVAGNVIVTANFSTGPVATDMAVGKIYTLLVSSVEGGLKNFVKAPTASGLFIYKGKDKKGKLNPTQKIDKKNPALQVGLEWSSPAPLLEKKIWTANKTLTTKQILEANSPQPIVFDLIVSAQDTDGKKVKNAGTGIKLSLRPPEITKITNENGETINIASAGQKIVIVGIMFGKRIPAVWIEYPLYDGDGVTVKKIAQLKLKVDKNSLKYKDYKDKPSCMDTTTGESELAVYMPEEWPKELAPGAHNIVIDNRVCRATIDFNTQE